MATKTAKNRKPMTSRAKGIICLLILLALTVCVSYLAIFGLELNGAEELHPWIPVSSANWPVSLPLNRALGGGTYKEFLLPEGTESTVLNDSMNTIRNRLAGYNESDGAVTAENGVLRLELRDMEENRLKEIRARVIAPGKMTFTSTSGDVVLTEKDIKETAVSYSQSATQVTYLLSMKVTDEAREKLNGAAALTVDVDGATYGTAYPNAAGDAVEMSFSSDDYYTMTNLDFIWRSGTVDVDLNNTKNITGKLDASLNIVLKVVLWVCAAMLALALVYTLAVGKLTGVSAFLSIWWAVIIALFLVAAVVISSITTLSAGCLIAILLGVLLAVFTAVTRTDAISKQIGEGSTPKSATKLGFKLTAKTVWIIHGAAACLSLILMIFAATRPIGYCLFAGVLASAVATVIMRAFQACFTAITSKPASFGKAQ